MNKYIYSIVFLFFFLIISNPVFSQCTTTNSSDCECLDNNETDCDLLPDITLSWYGLKFVSDGPSEYAQDYDGADAGRLRISASTPNDGVGPLTVRGVDANGWAYFICGEDTIVDYEPESNLEGYYCDDSDEPAKQITFQRIYQKNSDGTMGFYDRMAGSMTYHPTHGHNHSDDWGVFTLRTIDENEPNPLNWPIVSDGAKMGFCLMDYGVCGTSTASTYYGHCRDENRYGDDYLEIFPEFNDGTDGGTVKYDSDFPNFGLGGGSYGCSPIEQGISAGYLDLYGQWLDDQWINLEPGLCNGTYWIVGEVDKNDNYLESNEENNWTAIPVTLTQQLDGGGYDISIMAPDVNNICDGEVLTLNSSSNNVNSYLWSNGETSSSIDVNQSGTYSLTTTSECGDGQSQEISVVVNDPVDSPISESISIATGESAILNATGTGNILWYDVNDNLIGQGETFNSSPLYENTTFYVVNEEVLAEATENLYTGSPEHEGSSEYSGSVYNGGLRFDCLSNFTLNSVKVYTDTEGERTIQLLNSSNDIVNEISININATGDNGTTINLNWEINEGSDYMLTTDATTNNTNFGDNSPLLRRTTDGLPNFPYIIDDIVEINEGYYNNGDNPGFSTDYYYYFYNWEINNQWNVGGEYCYSEGVPVEVIVLDSTAGCTDFDACNFNSDANSDDGSCIYVDGVCESCINGEINNNDADADGICNENDCSPDVYNPEQDCSNINEASLYNFSIYPNPVIDQINIKFSNNMTKVSLKLYNGLGRLIKEVYMGDVNDSQVINIDTKNLSNGNYFISCLNKETVLKQSFTIAK
jgi:hypothetical protein